jgi:hypothetical protein
MPLSFYSDLEDTKIQTYPLGAYYDGHGIYFLLNSEFTSRVYFDQVMMKKKQLIEYARINIKHKLSIQQRSFVCMWIIHLKNSLRFRTNSSNLTYLST